MDRATLNSLLLNMGISTAGLAFGLGTTLIIKLFRNSLELRDMPEPVVNLLSRIVFWTIMLGTAVMILFRDHVTLRRIFLIVTTTVASYALWRVRDIAEPTARSE